MKPPKHLVLDEDVHRALRKKKADTGITVKDLGNCALRSVIERPLLAEAIGAKLVSDGLLSEEQFNDIRDEALQQICTMSADVSSIVRSTNHNTVTAGSWEIAELDREAKGSYQVLSVWVRDHRMRPMKMHKHAGVEFLNLLEGAALVTIDLDSRVLTAPDTVMIPANAIHSMTPMERKTRLVAVLSPPEPGYRAEQPE
jgi:mannose-6-phosphate isomerase-like protein (cupin superfamily)